MKKQVAFLIAFAWGFCSLADTKLFAVGDVYPNSSLTPSSMELTKGQTVDLSNVTRVGYTIDHSAWTYDIRIDMADPSRPAYADGFVVPVGMMGSFVPSNYDRDTHYRVVEGLLTGALIAVTTPNVYAISYQLNGGTAGTSRPTTATYDSAFSVSAPTRTGYAFKGWRVTENLNTATAKWGSGSTTNRIDSTSTRCGADQLSVWFLNVTASTGATVKLSAEWEAKTYTVTFNANGGVSSETTKSVTYGSEYGTLPNPTFAGNTFAGWWTAASGGTEVTSSTVVSITSAQTLYAHWSPNEYTLTVDPNGGVYRGSDDPTDLSPKLSYGSRNWNSIGIATRAGYELKGYYANFDSTEKVYDAEGVCVVGRYWTADRTFCGSDNLKVNAQWRGAGYSVRLDQQGATTVGTTNIQVTYQAAMPQITVPARTGYTFGGYYTAASGGGMQYYGSDGSSARLWDMTAGTTLYAKWTPNIYRVTFNGNGASSGGSESETFGAVYKFPSTPLRTGYAFAGWWTAASGGTQVTASTTVSTARDHTLYAHWTANEYTLTLDPNGGAISGVKDPVVKSPKLKYDSKNWRSVSVPTRTGYTFAGWWTATSGGTQVYDAAGRNVKCANWTADYANEGVFCGTSDLTVYAHWTANVYELAYDNLFVLERWTHAAKTAVLGPAAYTNGSSLAVDLVNGSVALANARSSGEVYTSTPQSGADGVYAFPVEAGTAYECSFQWTGTATSVDVFVFWQQADRASLGHVHASSTKPGMVTFTVTAPAGAALAQLRFDNNTGGSVATFSRVRVRPVNPFASVACTAVRKTFSYDDALGASFGSLATPTRTGYAFAGWWTAVSGGARVTESTRLFPCSTNLWSRWTANRHVVRFDANGGTTPTVSNVVAYAATYGTLPTPKRTGYAFAGWWTKSSGGTQVTASTTVTNDTDHTLYAHWTAKTYVVTFGKNGGTGGSESAKPTYGQAMPKIIPPTRTGYAFEGYWTTVNPGGVKYYNADGSSARTWDLDTTTAKLWAKWTAEVYEITLSPDNGGTGRSGTTTFYHRYGAAANYVYQDCSDLLDDQGRRLPECPTRRGYAFAGYWTETNGLGRCMIDATGVVVDLSAVAGDQTYHGAWTPNVYAITFDANGGTGTMAALQATYDQPATLPQCTLSRTGYPFAGWATSKDGRVQYADGAVVTNLATSGGYTLYARWGAAETYEVVFHGCGGVTREGATEIRQELTYDQPESLTANPFERDGWLFAGWATNEQTAAAGTWVYEDGARVSNLTASVEATIDLHAVWTGRTYRVVFDAGKGLIAQSDAAHIECKTNWVQGSTTEWSSIDTNYVGYASRYETFVTVGTSWQWPEVVQTDAASRFVFAHAWRFVDTNGVEYVVSEGDSAWSTVPPASRGMTNLVSVWEWLPSMNGLSEAVDWPAADFVPFENAEAYGWANWLVDSAAWGPHDTSRSSVYAMLDVGNPAAVMSTTVTGPGILTFDWRIVGQAYENSGSFSTGVALIFLPNAEDRGGILRSDDEHVFGAGSAEGWQTFSWTNEVDGPVTVTWSAEGYDLEMASTVWVDHVVWTPAGADYPAYIDTGDANLKSWYDSWKARYGSDDDSSKEIPFLLDVAPTTNVGEGLRIVSITESPKGEWDLAVESPANADLGGEVGTSHVGNGYLAVGFSSDLKNWTWANATITASGKGRVTIHVAKPAARFMKVRLSTRLR